MTETTNFGLKKPEETDFYSVDTQNDNMDAIDSVLQEFKDGTQQVGDSAKLGGKDASEYVLVKGTSLSTSILDYALTLGEGEFFMRLSGSSYSGNDLPDNNYAFGSAKIYKQGAGAITVSLLGSYSATLRRITSNYYNGSQWSGWNDEVITSDLANYLPLRGGTVVGISDYPIILDKNTESKYCYTQYKLKGVLAGSLGFAGVNNPVFENDAGTNYYSLLHTGNKPSGTYTGNGSATTRTISTGGIGNVCIIYSSISYRIVTNIGCFNPVDGTFSTEASFANGMIYVASTSTALNASGSGYSYAVL